MTTSYASGEGMQSRPRRRLARKPNKIRNIQLKNVSKRGTSKRQQALIAIRVAAKKGRKFVFLDMPWTKGKKGIYKITGGKESKRGGKTPIKIRMVHSLKKQSVTIKPNPWLGPAVKQVRKRMPNHFAGALRFQINRMRLFTSV